MRSSLCFPCSLLFESKIGPLEQERNKAICSTAVICISRKLLGQQLYFDMLSPGHSRFVVGAAEREFSFRCADVYLGALDEVSRQQFFR